MVQMQELDRSVIRVLNAEGTITVGTAFVISNHLAVTCAHVVEVAKSSCGQSLRIQFFHNDVVQTVQVLCEGWSPRTANDVAVLQLEHLPVGVVPVILGLAEKCI